MSIKICIKGGRNFRVDHHRLSSSSLIIIIIDSKAPSLRPRPPGIEPSPAGLVSDTLPLSYRPTPDRAAQISGSDTTTEEVSYHGLGVNLQQFRENVSTLLLTESKVGFVSCYIAQSVLELRANSRPVESDKYLVFNQHLHPSHTAHVQ